MKKQSVTMYHVYYKSSKVSTYNCREAVKFARMIVRAMGDISVLMYEDKSYIFSNYKENVNHTISFIKWLKGNKLLQTKHYYGCSELPRLKAQFIPHLKVYNTIRLLEIDIRILLNENRLLKEENDSLKERK
jgi:hypothetical protein